MGYHDNKDHVYELVDHDKLVDQYELVDHDESVYLHEYAHLVDELVIRVGLMFHDEENL